MSTQTRRLNPMVAPAGRRAEVVPIDVAAARARRQFARDVRRGLTGEGGKSIPCRYLYDTLGSILFEAITNVPEYGLTAADERLLRGECRDILDAAADDGEIAMVAELGCGSGRKTRPLLAEACRRGPTAYCPIEISPFALRQCQNELEDLVGLEWHAIAAEYLPGLAELAQLRQRARGRLLLLFLGSSYGNFSPLEGLEFMRRLRAYLQEGDAVLLGLDLVKPIAEMLAAYDDAGGVTAAFNLNLLVRINRELGADFNPRHFRHYVRYDDAHKRIEMHLLSLRRQQVTIPAARCEARLDEGETIWTESCHKFTPADIDTLAGATGFLCRRRWTDATWPFCESLLIAQ